MTTVRKGTIVAVQYIDEDDGSLCTTMGFLLADSTFSSSSGGNAPVGYFRRPPLGINVKDGCLHYNGSARIGGNVAGSIVVTILGQRVNGIPGADPALPNDGRIITFLPNPAPYAP